MAATADSTLPAPRLLVILAHPDDEVLAFGGRLERLENSRLVTVTDGTPTDGGDAAHHGFSSLEDYRLARQRELASALKHAGLSEQICHVPAPLPYADQTAAFHLQALAQILAREIHEFRPEAILTHPYEGGHPDHDACAFAVHTALSLVRNQRGSTALPFIVEAPFYHAGATGGMETGAFLQAASSTVLTCTLSLEEQQRKRERLACFISQQETLQQFSTERELFRLSPAYDFTQAPHAGTLFYEHFSWGTTGEDFRKMAAATLKNLGLAHSHGTSVHV